MLHVELIPDFIYNVFVRFQDTAFLEVGNQTPKTLRAESIMLFPRCI